MVGKKSVSLLAHRFESYPQHAYIRIWPKPISQFLSSLSTVWHLIWMTNVIGSLNTGWHLSWMTNVKIVLTVCRPGITKLILYC